MFWLAVQSRGGDPSSTGAFQQRDVKAVPVVKQLMHIYIYMYIYVYIYRERERASERERER